MLKEGAVTSVAVVLLTLLFGFALDGEPSTVVRYAAFAVGVVWLVIGVLQIRVVRAVGQAKIERLFNRDMNRSGAVGDVIDVPSRRALPEPERVRIVPLVSHSLERGVMDTEGRGGEVVRVVQVARPVKEIDGVPECDLSFFVSRLTMRGHSRSAWAGLTMPSGRRVDSSYHAAMIACVEKVGGVNGRAKGSAGVLVLSPFEIAERLGVLVEVAQPA